MALVPEQTKHVQGRCAQSKFRCSRAKGHVEPSHVGARAVSVIHESGQGAMSSAKPKQPCNTPRGPGEA
eukprot:2488985-Lingulodinium_polyedra.AAC.1